jgi:hypothetical protein
MDTYLGYSFISSCVIAPLKTNSSVNGRIKMNINIPVGLLNRLTNTLFTPLGDERQVGHND